MKSPIWQYVLPFAVLYLISCAPSEKSTPDQQEAIVEGEIQVVSGFEVDSIYDPGKSGQGSWVALAEGANGRFYAGDQFGGLYQFQMPPVGETLDSLTVDSIALDIGYANGLLWAFNSLYVSVNRSWNGEGVTMASGIYRLTDTDGDGTLDSKKMLVKLNGGGEHGPHSMLVSPDGNQIYFIAGNHTNIPDEIVRNSRIPTNWGEDNLLPPYLDARGHANHIKAPGGWICKFDPDGTNWELVSVGYRNPFDFGFNADDELFAFDADMEWDIGMPWYRPIRINHVTSGSEFGWRTGTGKWRDYYPDNLGSVVDLGQGSPTGVVMGKDLTFASKYRNGLFALDWSFGTIYYVDLKSEGSGYIGSKEEFLSGVPLPLTDAIAGSDGHMYFATGGRRLESTLYRVRYTGPGSTDVVSEDNAEHEQLRALRHRLERLHQKTGADAVDVAWAQINHADREIRYAARLALEHQPIARWQKRYFEETDPQKIVQGGLALARSDQKRMRDQLLEKLLSVSPEHFEKNVDALRTTSIALIRLGDPKGALRQRLIDRLDANFPSEDSRLNRELASILIHLKDPRATAKTVDLLELYTNQKNADNPELISSEVAERSEQYGPAILDVMKYTPPSEAIYHGIALSHASAGWNEDLRRRYFTWFYDVMSAKGGLSFKATMENARVKAMSFVPDAQKAEFEELSGVYSPTPDLAGLPQPEGPGKAYNVHQLINVGRAALKDYDGEYADGRRLYAAALCESCHRMNGEGGINGPDLSNINTRFKLNDIMGAVFAPHDEISDQYAFTLFERKDGSKIAGRIASEDDDVITIMPNPYTSALKVDLPKSDIVSQGPSPMSPMPPGLMNRLNEEEIGDLIAFLMAGGNENHKIYGGTVETPETD